jgi:hypothetical protein
MSHNTWYNKSSRHSTDHRQEVSVPHLNNPYWHTVAPFVQPDNTVPKNLAELPFEMLVRTYSWTITSPDLLAVLISHVRCPGIIEVGAGTGYLAWLLRQTGLRVIASDIAPPDRYVNFFHSLSSPERRPIQCPTFGEVIEANGAIASQYPAYSLLIAWPPDENIIYEALKTYRGQQLILLAEWDFVTNPANSWTCPHYLRRNNWREVFRYQPIQWAARHNLVLLIFER